MVGKSRLAVVDGEREHHPGGRLLCDRFIEEWDEAGAKRDSSGVNR